MSFLDELTSKLTDAKTIASQKTQELTQNVKIQNIVLKEKRKRDDLLKSLGSAYYEKYRNDIDIEFQDLVSQIKLCNETIKSYTVDNALKTDQCTSCGKFIEKGISFCPHCGQKLKQSEEVVRVSDQETTSPAVDTFENIEVPVKTNQAFCTNCGATLADGALFCVECGSKV